MDCIFCKFKSLNILYQNELFFVVKDLNHLNTTHLLVIPKIHYEYYEGSNLKNVMQYAQELIKNLNLTNYRIVFNKGYPFQEIFHAHLHIISEKSL